MDFLQRVADATGEMGSFTLEHNDHKSYYRTVAEQLEEFTNYNFESEDEKNACIESNKLWSLQWYRVTPIGFTLYGASSLDNLGRFIEKILEGRE